MAKHKLTYSETAVYNFLKGVSPKWYSPTDIGQIVRGNGYHSSWASPICLSLKKKKLVNRSAVGKYRVPPPSKPSKVKRVAVVFATNRDGEIYSIRLAKDSDGWDKKVWHKATMITDEKYLGRKK